MSEHGSVLATLPRALLAYLRALGKDEAAIAREAEITLENDEDARVPRERVDALWEIAAREIGPAVGVRFALEMPPGNAGVLEVVTQSAPTVEASLGHICRYWHLLNDGVDLSLERKEDEFALTLRTRSEEPLAPPWVDLTVVALVVIGARSIARPVPPKRVALPYAESRAVPELGAIVGAPMSYGADALAIVFPAELLDATLLAANAPLHDVARAHADAELARLKQDGDLPSRVRAAAETRLESGDATLDRLAGAVGLSARTLQRRLREHGTSLRAVLDDARRAIAMRELSARTRTVTDVAFLLGFSETSAFDRAFRRWTGTTPAAFRKNSR